MSAGPQIPINPTPPPSSPAGANSPNEITIVSHSNLVYWWPVWAVGFLMAALTYWDKHRVVIVPAATEALRGVPAAELKAGLHGPRDVLVLPEGSKLSDDPLKLHAAKNKNYGVLFATTLLLVIVITNVPLRGGWSFALIIFAIMVAIILALADMWERILEHLSYLDIRINVGGYLFISSILFVLWLITLLVFDRRIYMTFTPGQFKVCTEIGGGEKVYSSAGMALEKQRSDLFRHWILGLGSGDLVVKTSGAQAHEFDLHNVLFIGNKVKQIEQMLKKSVVVASR